MPTSIEHLQGPGTLSRYRLCEGDEVVELVPERGGLVTRFRRGADEVLFLDEATLVDQSKNVRGGVPLLFPFAGKPPAGSTLGQHGFARKLPWAVVASTTEPTPQVTVRLESTPDTLAAWPYAFRCDYTVALAAGRLTLTWAFHNPGTAPYPLHFGIHPYFHTPDKAHAHLEVGQTRAFDNRLGAEREVPAVELNGVEIDLHFSPFERCGLDFARGDGSVLKLKWSAAMKTLVLWTLPGQPFVCIEPWTARGQHPSALQVAPGQVLQLSVECWLA